MFDPILISMKPCEGGKTETYYIVKNKIEEYNENKLPEESIFELSDMVEIDFAYWWELRYWRIILKHYLS